MTDPLGPQPRFAAPYAPTPEGFTDELREVENNSLLWLILAGIGFWFGLGWLTGPLAWYYGAKARGRYLALGRAPSGKADGAWIVGIVTTVLSYLAVAVILLFVALVGAAAFSVQF
jgi:hypothetical protein